MLMAIELFTTGFLLGFGPCLLYCAPVLLPYIVGTSDNWRQGLRTTLTFSIARLLAYGLLGTAAGLSGQFIGRFVQSASLIETLGGIIVAAMGVLMVLGKEAGPRLCTLLRSEGNPAILGFLTGLSPCPPLVGALIGIALSTTSPGLNPGLRGLLYGLAFGSGTILSPLLALGALAGGFSGRLMRKPSLRIWLQRLSGLVLFAFGLHLVVRQVLLSLGG